MSFNTQSQRLVRARMGRIEQLAEKGFTANQIAKDIGCTYPTVFKHVQAMRPDIYARLRQNTNPGRSRASTKHSLEEMLRLSEEGFGHDFIAGRLGCDPSTVYHRLKNYLSPEEYAARHSKEKYTSGHSGRYFVNERGDVLQSSYEAKVADWLFARGVPYQLHRRVEAGGKTFYPDFVLPLQGLYVEVFGLDDREFYRGPMERKLAIYQAHQLPFISIYAKEIRKSDLWKNKLSTTLLLPLPILASLP